MRSVKIFAAVLLTAAVAATGVVLAHATATHPAAAAPTVPVATAPTPTTSTPTAPTLIAKPSPQPPGRQSPDVPIGQVPAPQPVLADGRYDAYINKVDIGHHQVVVDLVQVFQDQAAVQAAIADGTPRDKAQYLSVYVRNQNPRLRTLPLAGDVRIDLWRTCDDPKPVSVLLAKLASNARLGWYYYTLTVTDGTVHQIKETFKGNAC
jgi:hypothetical protein